MDLYAIFRRPLRLQLGPGPGHERIRSRRALLTLAQRQGISRAEAQAWATGLAGAVPWSLPALRREWNRAKAEVAPWWAENSKEAYSSGFDALATAVAKVTTPDKTPPPGNRWLRNLASLEVTDETDFGTM